MKGQPRRFVRGHNRQGLADSEWVEDPVTGCWEWQRSKTDRGYGYFKLEPSRKAHRAHRAYYRRFKGAIPDGMAVHHKCSNRGCVNPGHLELIDPKEHDALARLGVVPIAEYERVLLRLGELEGRLEGCSCRS